MLTIMLVLMLIPMNAIAASNPVMTYEPGAFMESVLNDGAVTGAKYVYLEGATFKNENFVRGTHYTTSNVPAGLTLNATRISSTIVKLDLTGKATNHEQDLFSYMKIEFKNQAFSGVNANRVSNWVNNNLQIQFTNAKPVRVLEVYPSQVTNASTGVQDVYDLLKNDENYIITSMTMNKFISLKEDINGKYDVLYFGKGRYFKGGVNESIYGIDITNLAAEKALEFIIANQLCIFHETAFKGDAVDGTAGKTPVTNMFTKFNGITSRSNVKIVTDVDKISYINNIKTEYKKYNQRPSLTINQQPYSYRYLGQAIPNGSLVFNYRVNDPNVDTDKMLTADLYIDRNNDSLFEEQEKIDSHQVKNGESDTISFNMPQGLTGVYFWKLVIKDNLGAKDEVVDVFRLLGSEVTVRVLQIKPNNGGNVSLTSLFNKEMPGGVSGEKYGNKAGHYKVDVTEATINEFNAGLASKNLRNLNGSYDMVVLGFVDDYSKYSVFNAAATAELDKFIQTKQSVMFTHDSIHFYHNLALTGVFKDDVGQAGGYTAGLAGFLSASIPIPLRDEYPGLNSNYYLSNYQLISPNNTAKLVRPVNSTAITLYPFNLESYSQTQMSVASTHYQWFKLDLEDREVIPLFNLYKGSLGDRLNDDAMNNYYTYTKGNITYSGTGHSSGYPDYEVMLFVNTALKAYSVANHAPEITVFEPQDYGKVNSLNSKFKLSFRPFDFDYEDTELNYKIYADYDGNGFVSAATPAAAVNGNVVNLDINNKPSIGSFKLKIEVTDARGAASSKIINLENTQAPNINSSVTIKDLSGNPVTECLTGETVNVEAKFSPEGYMNPEKLVNVNYNLKSIYKNSTETNIITNAALGSVSFKPTLMPTPGILTKSHTVVVNPPSTGQTTLTFEASTDFLPSTSGINSLNVRNGQVKITVVDEQNNRIEGAEIRNVTNSTSEGYSDSSGQLTINGVIGEKEYSIVAPTGYLFEDVKQIYKQNLDANGNNTTRVPVSGDKVTLTYNDSVWEIVFQLKLDISINAQYYRLKQSATTSSVTLLEGTAPNFIYKNQVNAKAKLATHIEIDEIGTVPVTEIAVNVKTLDKHGVVITDTVSPYLAKVVETAVPRPATFAATTNQLKANNTTPPAPIPPATVATYAGKSYYIVIEVQKTDGQKVQVDSIELTMGNGSIYSIPLDSIITFAKPSTPLLR